MHILVFPSISFAMSDDNYREDDVYREGLKKRLAHHITNEDRKYLARFLSQPFPTKSGSNSQNEDGTLANIKNQDKAVQTNDCRLSDGPTYDDIIEWLNYQYSQKEELRNVAEIKRCMNATFLHRHHIIMSAEPSILEIKEQFPILFDRQQVMDEFERTTLLGTIEVYRNNLENCCSKLLSLKSSKSIRHLVKKKKEIIKAKEKDSRQRNEIVKNLKMKGALLCLPSIFGEDIKNIVQFESLSPLKDYPVLVCSSSLSRALRTETRFKLYAEKMLVSCTQCMIEAFLMFVASFYIFSIQFPSRCIKTILLIKHLLMDLTIEADEEGENSAEIIDLKKKLLKM